MLEEFNEIATRVAEMLRARGEKIAVVDGATGGLISASLLTVPGALSFYMGGGVMYSSRGRDILFGDAAASLGKPRSGAAEYALLQARAIRDNFGSAWGIAESGAAGGSKHPGGLASGLSCCAIAGPNGIEVTQITETQSDDRLANMQMFTRRALTFLESTMAQAG